MLGCEVAVVKLLLGARRLCIRNRFGLACCLARAASYRLLMQSWRSACRSLTLYNEAMHRDALRC